MLNCKHAIKWHHGVQISIPMVSVDLFLWVTEHRHGGSSPSQKSAPRPRELSATNLIFGRPCRHLSGCRELPKQRSAHCSRYRPAGLVAPEPVCRNSVNFGSLRRRILSSWNKPVRPLDLQSPVSAVLPGPCKEQAPVAFPAVINGCTIPFEGHRARDSGQKSLLKDQQQIHYTSCLFLERHHMAFLLTIDLLLPFFTELSLVANVGIKPLFRI